MRHDHTSNHEFESTHKASLPQKSYFLVNRNFFEDNTISINCRYLLIYILLKTETDGISIQEIICELDKEFSPKEIYHLIEEAEKAGYMKKTKLTCDYYITCKKNLGISDE
jgi:hypothetical protein